MPRPKKSDGPIAIEPRKRPQQQRSQIVVQRILDAARIQMREERSSAFTTIAVARRAGLSVGSLYQYFPNKEAIIFELAGRWLQAAREVVESLADLPSPLDWAHLEAHIRDFHERMSAVYYGHADLLPILNAMGSNSELSRIDGEHNDWVVGFVAGTLQAINPRLETGTARRLADLMLRTGHASLDFAADRGGPSPEADVIIEDLNRITLELFRPYLELT